MPSEPDVEYEPDVENELETEEATEEGEQDKDDTLIPGSNDLNHQTESTGTITYYTAIIVRFYSFSDRILTRF